MFLLSRFEIFDFIARKFTVDFGAVLDHSKLARFQCGMNVRQLLEKRSLITFADELVHYHLVLIAQLTEYCIMLEILAL